MGSPERRGGATHDISDNKSLELEVSGRATHIISGDSDLLSLNAFQGIPVLSSSAFPSTGPISRKWSRGGFVIKQGFLIWGKSLLCLSDFHPVLKVDLTNQLRDL